NQEGLGSSGHHKKGTLSKLRAALASNQSPRTCAKSLQGDSLTRNPALTDACATLFNGRKYADLAKTMICHPSFFAASLLLLSLLVSGLAAQESAKGYPDASAEQVAADLFVVPEGLEVTLWANSPQLFNPTNIDIDQ